MKSFASFIKNIVPYSKFKEAKIWTDFYDKDVPDEIYIPDMTINDIWDATVKKYPTNHALIYFGKNISYHYLDELVKKFSSGLLAQGLQRGDRVAIMLPNIPQFLITYLAALRIGAVAVLINPLLSGREAFMQFKDSGAKFIVTIDRLFPRVNRILHKIDVEKVIICYVETYMPSFLSMALQLKNKVLLKKDKFDSNKVLYFRQLFNYVVPEKPHVKPDDTAILLYTGGVTGKSKAAVLTHQNLVANVLQSRAWITNLKEGCEKIMAVLPFIHSYGLTACLHLSLQSGSTLVLEPRFKIKRLLADIKKYQITIFPGVPTLFAAIVNYQGLQSNTLESVHSCISGGSPLPLFVKRKFEELSGGKLVEGYGLTEASPITHCNPLYGINKERCIGLPYPNTDARIVDVQTREILKSSQIGELEVKGPQVMRGYWKNKNETVKVLSRDGWLATGDIAYFDEQGFFYILDRKKDIILSGGYNIYPSEIENVLLEHPNIAEAAVCGIPDDFYGEKVHAFIITRNGLKIDKKELIRFCEGKLGRYKIPKEFIYKTAFPKNFLGKVLKRELNKNSRV